MRKFIVYFLYVGFCYASSISDPSLEDTNRLHTPLQTHRSSGNESLLIGAVSGALESIVNHPLWVWKTRAQYDAPITFNPRLMYKGVGSRVPVMSILTGCRLTIRDELITCFYDPSHLTLVQNFLTSFSGGFLAAPLSSVLELTHIQQQIHHKNPTYNSFVSTVSQISQYGRTHLARGLGMGSIRDGTIVASVFSLTPTFSYWLKDMGFPDSTKLLAGLGSGFASAILSHPFDTIKSIQQAFTLDKKLPGFWAVGKNVIQKNGLSGLYRGFFWRTTRLVIASPLLFYSTEYLTKAKQTYLNNEKEI